MQKRMLDQSTLSQSSVINARYSYYDHLVISEVSNLSAPLSLCTSVRPSGSESLNTLARMLWLAVYIALLEVHKSSK